MRSVLKASRQTMKVSLPSPVIVLNNICIWLMVGCEVKGQRLHQDIWIEGHLIQDRSAWFVYDLINFFRIQIADSFQV